jgi:hypothetical protein
MNKQEYIAGCVKYFGRLVHEIKASNAVGHFDINSVAEDLFVPIISILYNCPELENQNEIVHNFPAVDLGCRKSRISFQVTSDAASGKIIETLKKFRAHNLDRHFDQLYVLIITEKQASYTSKALELEIQSLSIPFTPSDNIIDSNDLLRKIKKLETDKLEIVYSHLDREFTKRDEHLQFRQELGDFLDFSRSKIEIEKNSKKYIPSIFVETHSAKEEMRLFANPLFFYRKIDDLVRSVEYSRLNELLTLARQPVLQPSLEGIINLSTPETLSQLKESLSTQKTLILQERAKVAPLSWKAREHGGKYKPTEGNETIWNVVRHKLESNATGIYYKFDDAISLIALIQKKIFLVTGMAGQGKTNFVCDLVENQFRDFGIPCIFIPARELNSFPSGNRIFGFISNNRFAPKLASIHEYLELFNSVADENNKPFLIAIDGINEVSTLDAFNAELKIFCNAICQYENIKVLITCRSEFFDAKFKSIMNEPFSKEIHRISDLRSEMTEDTKHRLLASYLSHFNISGTLSDRVESFLKDDLILLRIFCELHEGQNVGSIAEIYKGDLFEAYLQRRIEASPSAMQGRALPTLFKVASRMLERDDYSHLSVRDFPLDELEIVNGLIADDIVLRQEIPQAGLLSLGDLVISFTYDELRDFIIAFYLMNEVWTKSPDAFEGVLRRLPSLPIFEGVFKYVYVLARRSKNEAAIAHCELVPDFLDHYAPNISLLPPLLQTSDDIEKVQGILHDLKKPERLRWVSNFLFHRTDKAELLNIHLLVQHLNSLSDHEHQAFHQVVFSSRDDFGSRDWRHRVDKILDRVLNKIEIGGSRVNIGRFAFYLHIACHANWQQQERVGLYLSRSRSDTNLQQSVSLVRGAVTIRLKEVLADFDSSEEVT